MKTLLIILTAITLFSCSKNKSTYVYKFRYKSPQMSTDTSKFAGSNSLFDHELIGTELVNEQNKLIESTQNQLKITITYSELKFEYIDTEGKW